MPSWIGENRSEEKKKTTKKKKARGEEKGHFLTVLSVVPGRRIREMYRVVDWREQIKGEEEAYKEGKGPRRRKRPLSYLFFITKTKSFGFRILISFLLPKRTFWANEMKKKKRKGQW